MKRRSQIVLLVIVLLIVAGLAVIFQPAPIPVQTVSIQPGLLQEVVEEEGKTRMRDHFIVAATVSG